MATTKKGNKTVHVRSYKRARPHQKGKSVNVESYNMRP